MIDDYYNACCDLADLIKNNKVYDHGMAIQFFCGYVGDGETPKMALVMVKNQLKWPEELIGSAETKTPLDTNIEEG